LLLIKDQNWTPNSDAIPPRAWYIEFRTCLRLAPNDVREHVQTVCHNIILSLESGFTSFLRQNFIDAATLIVLLTQNTIPVKDTPALGTGLSRNHAHKKTVQVAAEIYSLLITQLLYCFSKLCLE
jgi:hypothetical protein